MNPAAEILFAYLGDVIYHPQKATLNLESLPEDFRELGEGLKFFVGCVQEMRAFAIALSKGDLSFKTPSTDNELAAPLKGLQASLKHVAWQTQQVAKGDYKQRVEFMGDFSNAFNMMIDQLERQRSDLIEAKKTAEAASESKTAFLATVSHEIRTPLNSILGLSTMELEKNLPSQTRSNLERIFSSGSNLLSIVNDILDISKIEAGGFLLTPADYVVPNMINDVVELSIVRFETKDLVFELDIDQSIPIKMNGDELRVKQILNNLLSNACKYTEEGSVKFEIGWRNLGSYGILKFSVTDTGIGIRREDIPKLFKEYSQLNQRPNRNIEGTGLGLVITKHLVDMMSGSLTVESEYGVGSRFVVEIPQRIISDVPIGRALADGLKNFQFDGNRRKRDRNLVRAHMPYGRVLIVDDVITNLDVAKGLMLPYELNIDCATSGMEAINRVEAIGEAAPKERYDIIFMDHMMPEMDGVEATRIIREEIGSAYAQTVPIVALTANALAGNEDMFLSKGFNDYLSKPIDIIKLDAILNKWVRDIQSDQTLRAAERRKADKLVIEERGSIAPEYLDDEIAGLDLKTGMTTFGNESTFLKILQSYVTHTKSMLNKLNITSGSQLEEYAIIVHGLKGASRGIFATEVGKLAEDLERSAKSNDFATVMAKKSYLLETTKTLVADIEKYLAKVAEKPVPSSSRERKTAPEPEILEKMRDAAKRFKTSLMEDFMAEIERYDYESGAELVNWLRRSVNELEYGAIVERLEDFSKDGNNPLR